MKKLILVLFSLLIHFSSNAYAGAMTADDLQKICIASDSQNKVMCKFYILGIAQGLNLGMAVADGEIQGGRPDEREGQQS